MPTVTIEASGCRDCSLCIDICPTKVFDQDKAKGIAVASRPKDCIGCTSCQYICPSRCLEVGDFVEQRPFFRIEENVAIIARFVQRTPVTALLTDADMKEALGDVAVRLLALGDSVTETMGRGLKAVGRKAGALAASHLPEMYEDKSIEAVVAGMKKRFAGSFDFEAQVAQGGDTISMTFPKCALADVVRTRGQTVGDAVVCSLFHEYWAGLLGAFAGKNYGIEQTSAGDRCTMKLQTRTQGGG
jgi:NAD-dependent dihydropyrimidine dehydrogenase PreA subunit